MDFIDLSIDLSKDEKREIAEEMFSKLFVIYQSMANYYNELGIALKEKDLYQDSNLDTYLPIEKKLEYIMININYLSTMERDI